MQSIYVKFVKYNTNCIHSLIKKNVRFSTIFDFNDFNEAHYLNSKSVIDDSELLNIINKEGAENIINKLYSLGYTDLENLKFISINEASIESLRNSLIEYDAYSSVGIFCLSSINVFQDDSAQLMFAHYAENLKGVALIFRCNNTPSKVEYYENKPASGGKVERVRDWKQGKYDKDEMDDFLNKSKKWEYENEYRLFNIPGEHSMESCGLELKCILYTPRMEKRNLNVIQAINETSYNNTINIEGISRSFSKYKFMINSYDVCSWLASIT